MQRIATATKSVDLFGAGKHGFKDGNLGTGVLPTDFEALFCNNLQEELLSIIEEQGIAPNSGVLTQVRQAIKRMTGGNITTVNAANSPFALTADNAGLVIMDATAGNIIANLPAANVITAKLEFKFVRKDATANTATGNCAGADTLVGGAVSFTLSGQGDYRCLAGDSTSKWATTAVPLAAIKQIQSLTATVAANALTLGIAASQFDFRNATLGTGTTTTVSFGALSLVVPSGATLGTVSGQQSRVIPIVINNGGVAELAVINLSGGINLDESGLISTTAISGASNSASVAYSTTARANVPYRIAGFVDSTQGAAGTWATPPSTIQGAGGLAANSLVGAGTGKWVNRTGSRSQGVTYYNTDGVERKVALQGSTGSATDEFLATIDGVLTVRGGYAGTSLYSTMSTLFIVPAGSSYSVNSIGGSVSVWMEAR